MSASYDASLSGADQEAVGRPEPRPGQRDRRNAGEIHPRDARHQQGAGRPTDAVESEISNLQQSLEAIRAESLTDPLTGLGNRKYFDRSIETAVQTALGDGEPLSLLMFDIDHFKSFNDSYGHLTGDQVLRLVGMSLKQTIKGQDITARYGGEEFAVVLPNTALRQALTVADHIRRAVMSKELKKKSTGEILGRVTISVGVSMLKPGDDYRLADRTRGCLPLRRQAQRPQPRHLRSRSGIRRRDPKSGRLKKQPSGGNACVNFPDANFFRFAVFFVTAFFLRNFGRLRRAARCAAANAALAQSVSSSGSSYSRSGRCQYEPTVTVLALV